ncbi:structure-specific endonuclease subunit EME2 [Microcaecilia unicolor]|uniref:Structure-specific endonuclease subunit EME2 n=1 Tax=Microcaecilia unicolor TaxID=1415580 RepID=A0A6P7YIJ3_9AMPH|nr:probable crossover junction endonuclease EME2 [Microcaecilia unicolor]
MGTEFKEELCSPEFDSKISRSLKGRIRQVTDWEVSDSEPESNAESCKNGSDDLINLMHSSLGSETCDLEEKVMLNIGAKDSTLALPILPSVSPKKRHRKNKSPEEVEADQAKAKERKLERESKRLQREQEKVEKQRRKEVAEALKLLRPDQCMKYLTIHVDPGILEDAGSDVLMEMLNSLECKYYIEPQLVPHSITWRREMPSSWLFVTNVDVKVGKEDEMLVLMEPEDFLRNIFLLTQSSSSDLTEKKCDLPPGFTFAIPDGHHKKLCLTVIGLDAYHWQSLHRSEDQNKDGDSSAEHISKNPVTQQQIEEALVMLQLWSDTNVLFLDSWQEFGQHICAMTKAIAQRPYKKHSENHKFSFCTTDGGWSSGIRVKKDGTGLQQVWKRQIEQFNRVSPAMAAAVSSAYPSPHLLLQAYEKCSTEQERLNLLSDLQIRAVSSTERVHSYGPAVTEKKQLEDEEQPLVMECHRARRIGPDLSRRVYCLMTSRNPDLVLDLNS